MSLKGKLELVWWLVTAVATVCVVFPIVSRAEVYPYLWENVAMVVVFITATRHIFFLKHSLMAHNMIAKIVGIVACVPVIAFLVQQTNGIQYFLDYMSIYDWDKHFGAGTLEEQKSIKNYMRSEMLFFGTASIIACLVLAGRLVVSLWMQKNRGRV